MLQAVHTPDLRPDLSLGTHQSDLPPTPRTWNHMNPATGQQTECAQNDRDASRTPPNLPLLVREYIDTHGPQSSSLQTRAEDEPQHAPASTGHAIIALPRLPRPVALRVPTKTFQNVLDIPEMMEDIGAMDVQNLMIEWGTKRCMHVPYECENSASDAVDMLACCTQHAHASRRSIFWVPPLKRSDIDDYEIGDQLFELRAPTEEVVMATCSRKKNLLEGLTIKLGETGCLLFDDRNEDTELRNITVQGWNLLLDCSAVHKLPVVLLHVSFRFSDCKHCVLMLGHVT
jgi:hypothetical protein